MGLSQCSCPASPCEPPGPAEPCTSEPPDPFFIDNGLSAWATGRQSSDSAVTMPAGNAVMDFMSFDLPEWTCAGTRCLCWREPPRKLPRLPLRRLDSMGRLGANVLDLELTVCLDVRGDGAAI